VKRPAIVAIALIATIAIYLQLGTSLLALVWGLIHGAGPAAMSALVPLAGSLLLLWGGAIFLSRRAGRGMPMLFGLYSAAILLLNEALLPATPLKTWMTQRAIEAVEIRNIRDELVLSAHGNPIGIRLIFEAIFPRSGDYVIAYALQSEDDRPYALQFNNSFGVGGMVSAAASEIDPEPREDHYFRQGVVYTFREVRLPNFLSYDDKAGEPCLNEKYLQKDFLTVLSKSRDLKYRTQIRVSSEQAYEPLTAAEYVTSRAYDIESIYRTIQTEGNRRCGS
jgi:hypothetical protein